MTGSEEKDLEKLLRNFFVRQKVSHIVINPNKRDRFGDILKAIDYAQDKSWVVLDEEITKEVSGQPELKDMVAYKLTVEGKEYFGLYSEVN